VAVTYGTFKSRNPEYEQYGKPRDGDQSSLWEQLAALAAGGVQLLRNKRVMHDVFPRHTVEHEKVYEERQRRALYVGYANHVTGYLLAHLFSQSISMEIDSGETGEDGKPKPGKPTDAFYEDFAEDVSEPGGKKQSLNELLKEQIKTGMVKRRAWTLVDLPKPRVDANAETAASRADQEKAGDLDAYAVALDPECVLDWEFDRTGALLWLLMVNATQKRAGLEGNRNMRREEYTFYDQAGWARYVFVYDVTKHPNGPPDDTAPSEPVESDTYQFKAVPVVPLELPDNLWLMNLIASAAISHFNLRSALNWAENKALFPQPFFAKAKREKGEVPVGIAADESRGTSQTMGVGYMLEGVQGDTFEYVGPDCAPFEFAGEDLAALRDEMYRVVTVMAQSVDNKGAALKRSGESKKQDTAAMAIVLEAYGDYVREHAQDVYEMIERGRGDQPQAWCPRGQEKFDDVDSATLLDEALTISTLDVPSATFKVEYTMSVVTRWLGDRGDDDMLAKIRDELEGHWTQDTIDNPIEPGMDPNAPQGMPGQKPSPKPGAKPTPPAK
jgi:hypothetical protein